MKNHAVAVEKTEMKFNYSIGVRSKLRDRRIISLEYGCSSRGLFSIRPNRL